MSHSFLNLEWNGSGSNLTGWDLIGAENLSREDLQTQPSKKFEVSWLQRLRNGYELSGFDVCASK